MQSQCIITNFVIPFCVIGTSKMDRMMNAFCEWALGMRFGLKFSHRVWMYWLDMVFILLLSLLYISSWQGFGYGSPIVEWTDEALCNGVCLYCIWYGFRCVPPPFPFRIRLIRSVIGRLFAASETPRVALATGMGSKTFGAFHSSWPNLLVNHNRHQRPAQIITGVHTKTFFFSTPFPFRPFRLV